MERGVIFDTTQCGPLKELVKHRARWVHRVDSAKQSGFFERVAQAQLRPTPYAVEAFHYWHRARFLQEQNLKEFSGKKFKRLSCSDPLQDAIPIYDTVKRRYAGFSNVLEQLRFGDQAPKFLVNKARGRPLSVFKGTDEDWLYACLVHRMTGSGASFEHDHGWRNAIVPHMPFGQGLAHLAEFVKIHPGPSGTSIGNQFPAISSPVSLEGARNRLQWYLWKKGPVLVKRLYQRLLARRAAHLSNGEPLPTVQSVTDEALAINSELGEKRFVFQLTAWVMDIAEYFPGLVDPNSDCYHGKNAQAALNLCFRPATRMTSQAFFDAGTRVFCDLTGTHPMDVEDAAPGCDLVRWLENYVPAKGFEHVKKEKIVNSSSLHYRHGRQF